MDDGVDEGAKAYRPMPAHVPKALPHLRSRWLGGVSTCGPAGRVGWTALVAGVPLVTLTWAVWTTGVVGICLLGPFIVIWGTSGARIALKDIWAQDTYYVPLPPIPEVKSMTAWDGKRIPTLEEYVSGQLGTPPE